MCDFVLSAGASLSVTIQSGNPLSFCVSQNDSLKRQNCFFVPLKLHFFSQNDSLKRQNCIFFQAEFENPESRGREGGERYSIIANIFLFYPLFLFILFHGW